MKKQIIITCISLMAIAGIAETESTPSVVKSRKTTVKATVVDVDRGDREITVKGPHGKRVLKVGEDVRNFDQIRKGDEIEATYYESVGLSLAKKGEPTAAPIETGVVSVAAEGEKPGGVAAVTKRVTATVESIDPATREVTLKGPKGNMVTFKVDERVGDLSRIEKGDEVVAKYTESLAIAVTK